MSADREREREKNMVENPSDDKLSDSSDPSNTTREKEESVTASTNEIDTAERERRKKIKTLFGNLHAMLPHVPLQADKVTVVDETLNYIRILEQTLKNLEKKRMERLQSSSVSNGTSREAFKAEQVASSSSTTSPSRPHNNDDKPLVFQTWTSPNVVVNICGQDAQFSVCSSKNYRGLLTTICCVLEKYKIEVLSAHISCDNNRRFYMFQAQLQENGDSNKLAGALSAEETFKQAAAEIILSLS